MAMLGKTGLMFLFVCKTYTLNYTLFLGWASVDLQIFLQNVEGFNQTPLSTMHRLPLEKCLLVYWCCQYRYLTAPLTAILPNSLQQRHCSLQKGHSDLPSLAASFQDRSEYKPLTLLQHHDAQEEPGLD
jgi:hypothetical protein